MSLLTCTKDFSLTIGPAGCIDWTQLVWAGLSAQPERGASSFTAAGDSASFSCNDPGVGVGGTPDVQDGSATINFAGAVDCSCRVTFNATSFNNPVLGGSNLNGGFTILQDGNLVLELVINHGPGNPFNDGYYDSNTDGNIPHDVILSASPIIVPFKLLASVGSTIVIRGKGIVPSYIWLNANGNGENVFCDYNLKLETI
jgi:hypothetical protein